MIAEILFTGAENAQRAKDLCKILHIDSRTLTANIERERRQGKPICANCNGDMPGYYLAPDKPTMQEYCNRLARRAAEILKTKAACEATITDLPDGEA